MKINKQQIRNLILNAYGFMADYNDLYFCQEDYVQDETFELITNDDDCLEFTYNNASVSNNSVCFEDTDGELRSFTVLTVPTDMSKLLDTE